jgi:hypothetical protein
MDDLNALFDSVDGLKEDLIEYGTIAAAAVGANVAWNYASAWAMTKFGGTLPAWAKQYGVPAAAILAGIFGGRFVARYNRKAGMGVTIGLVAAGLTGYAKMFLPNLNYAVSGLGAGNEDLLLGFGETSLFQKYLNGAPSTVENVNGLGTTPIAIEESVSGFAGFGTAPSTVEEVSGLGDYDVSSSLVS